MLRRILLLGLLALTGCSAPPEKPPAAPLPISPLSAKPAPELIDSKPIIAEAEPIILEAEPIAPLAAVDQLPDQAAVIVTPAAPQPVMPLAYHSVLSQGITISAVYFDDRKFQLTVADQADGCGSQWLDAESAALSCDGYAAINGGFFTPEGKPLGLLVASGIKRGSLNNSSLGAGILNSMRPQAWPTMLRTSYKLAPCSSNTAKPPLGFPITMSGHAASSHGMENTTGPLDISIHQHSLVWQKH